MAHFINADSVLNVIVQKWSGVELLVIDVLLDDGKTLSY